jgi:FkbM family methyltransferase
MDMTYIKSFDLMVAESRLPFWKKVVHSPRKYLLSSLFARIGKFKKGGIAAVAGLFFGVEMKVAFPEEVSWFIYRNGFFEPELTRFSLGYLKPGMVWLDIGAHFGYFTLLCSQIVGEKGCVHSFEPTPRTFQMLSLNAAQRKGVFLNNLAVYSKERMIKFRDYGLKLSAFNSFFNPRINKEKASRLASREYHVKAVTIDRYVESKSLRPDFIKVDAEGAELEIIKGMKKIIELYKPVISLEVSDLDGANTSAELVRYLVSYGYVPHIMREGKLIRHIIKQTYVYDNIIFISKKEVGCIKDFK